MTDFERLYGHYDPEGLEPFFTEHMLAMTKENLRSKAEIACELAYRDKQQKTEKVVLLNELKNGLIDFIEDNCEASISKGWVDTDSDVTILEYESVEWAVKKYLDDKIKELEE